jgi:hypothetical protein
MKQQTNNSQSTTAQALTSFPENPQLYIFAYTITGKSTGSKLHREPLYQNFL